MALEYRQGFLGKGTHFGIKARLRLALEQGNPHDVIRCLLLKIRDVEWQPSHWLKNSDRSHPAWIGSGWWRDAPCRSERRQFLVCLGMIGHHHRCRLKHGRVG